MRLGFTNIYSFRPHVEHLVFLANLLRGAGHQTYFLTCDASVPNCYARLLKGTGRLRECAQCIAGGVRSYPVAPVTSIRRHLRGGLERAVLEDMVLSSAHTLNRTEAPEDATESAFLETRDKLLDAADIAAGNAMHWIEHNGLEGVICFNGRMDMTRAVTYACEQVGVPYITHERTWFGHGLRLVPNGDCLSQVELDRLIREYRDRPLTADQARLAARLGSERFLARNVLEWRLYNANRQSTDWPAPSGETRVLILPSSSNEYRGHPERQGDWSDYTQGFDQLLERLNLRPEHCVLRSHPNWSEYIGRVPGGQIERHYQDWADRRGVYCIQSAEPASTQDLIAQADLVVVNGSSAAIEAGLLARKIICLGHSAYQAAGFSLHIRAPGDWRRLEELNHYDPESIVRRTLRYIYVQAARFPQFARYVRAVTTTRYVYLEGADPGRITDILRSGRIEPDDPETAPDSRAEDAVVGDVINRDWHALAALQPEAEDWATVPVRRRIALRWIDGLRDRFPLGDRQA